MPPFPRLARLLLFLIGCVCSARAYQSNPRFDHFTIADGLSHDIVNSIAQDKEGFLWFGTEDGLNRFDGYTFRIYKHIPGDTTSLYNSWIRCLFVARDGTLWIGASGLQRYNPYTDSFLRCSFDSAATYRSDQPEVSAIAEDSSGTLWVGTNKGLYHIRPDGTFLRRYPRPVGSEIVSALHFDRMNNLWIGTGKGLGQFDFESENVKSVSEKTSGFSINHIFEDDGGNLWLSSMDQGVVRWDPSTGTARRYYRGADRRYRLSSNIAFTTAQDKHGNVWIGLVGAVNVIAPSGDVRQSLRNDASDPKSLNGSHVYAILCDRGGAMWLGTAHGGIHRFDEQRNRFGYYRARGNYQVFSILADHGGSIWLGSTEGLERFDPVSGRSSPAPSAIRDLHNETPQDVLALFQDREGFLWVGHREKRNLKRIDLRTGTVRQYPFPEVRSIFQDSDGEMWIGFWFDGVARLEPATGRYRRYTGNAHPDSLQGAGVWVIHERPNRELWMGTWGGTGALNIFNKATGRFGHLPPSEETREQRTGIYVRAILEDSAGALWLGTWGNGLQRYDPRTQQFEYFYEQQGLPSNFVKGLLKDDAGNLWVSTERGLSRFDVRTRHFRNFTADDGLQGDMFLSGSAWRDASGRMYFGGEDGLNYFHPDSIRDDQTPPPVVITGFRIFDKVQQPSAWRNTNVSLRYDQDFISFEFVALDYTNPSRNLYAYKLEGFDRDWIQAGTRRYAAYTHLDGDEYTFRVRASNSDGVWNEEGATLRIVISPPFWRTWWFIGGAAILIVASIYTGFRVRLRHQLALERMRQRIASDLHDDVGTELSSIVLGSQYLARTLPLKEADRSQIERIGSIATRTHEMMRDIVWMLRSDNDTLDELLVKMQEVAARLLAGVRYTFRGPTGAGRTRLHLETKRNLLLFYKEALNNIVRHSGASSVEITLEALENSLELSITDNGGGLDGVRPGAGAGLRSLHERVRAMKADMTIRPREGGGTVIRLTASAT